MAIRQKRKYEKMFDEVKQLPVSAGVVLEPVDTKHDHDADTVNLLRRLERNGDVQAVAPHKIVLGRNMYVKKFYSYAKIARQLEVDKSIVMRWATAFNWEEEKEREQFEQYQKISSIRKRTIDIDERHDRMFQNLETLVEDTLRQFQNGDVDVEVKDLKTLADVASKCMESRRTIHKREQSRTTVVSELQANGVFDKFASMMESAVLDEPNELKQIEVKVLDNEPKRIVHAEVVEDLEFEDQEG